MYALQPLPQPFLLLQNVHALQPGVRRQASAQPCSLSGGELGWFPWNDKEPTSKMSVSPLMFQGCLLKGSPAMQESIRRAVQEGPNTQV